MAKLTVYVAFDRVLLAAALADVKKQFPTIKASDAWVHRSGRDQWEFHCEHEDKRFYWYGRAWTAYEAKAKGWEAFLAKYGTKQEGQ